MDIGGNYREASHETQLADLHVHSEAI
jgi:hypothetical protein